jgi:hypothetical protein
LQRRNELAAEAVEAAKVTEATESTEAAEVTEAGEATEAAEVTDAAEVAAGGWVLGSSQRALLQQQATNWKLQKVAEATESTEAAKPAAEVVTMGRLRRLHKRQREGCFECGAPPTYPCRCDQPFDEQAEGASDETPTAAEAEDAADSAEVTAVVAEAEEAIDEQAEVAAEKTPTAADRMIRQWRLQANILVRQWRPQPKTRQALGLEVWGWGRRRQPPRGPEAPKGGRDGGGGSGARANSPRNGALARADDAACQTQRRLLPVVAEADSKPKLKPACKPMPNSKPKLKPTCKPKPTPKVQRGRLPRRPRSPRRARGEDAVDSAEVTAVVAEADEAIDEQAEVAAEETPAVVEADQALDEQAKDAAVSAVAFQTPSEGNPWTAQDPEQVEEWEQCRAGNMAVGKPVGVAAIVAEADVAEADEAEADEVEGHPLCTVGIDCIGSADLTTVRHLPDGPSPTGPAWSARQGDLYCEACWMSFETRLETEEGRIQFPKGLYGVCQNPLGENDRLWWDYVEPAYLTDYVAFVKREAASSCGSGRKRCGSGRKRKRLAKNLANKNPAKKATLSKNLGKGISIPYGSKKRELWRLVLRQDSVIYFII